MFFVCIFNTNVHSAGLEIFTCSNNWVLSEKLTRIKIERKEIDEIIVADL